MEASTLHLRRPGAGVSDEASHGKAAPAWREPSAVRRAQRHRLLGFFLLRLWTAAAERPGLFKQPFTRRENVVVQACVACACRVDIGGGFGTYLLAMSDALAKQETEADDDALNSKNPHLGWMIAFLFLVSFAGLLALVPLRKVMIVDYRLSYPSGLAAAYLINGLHATEANKNAKEQVGTLHKYFAFSFLWGFFQWFYSAGDGCGFQNFSTFGLEAYRKQVKS